MLALHSRSDMKVLRPERCVVLDGKRCVACTKDIELEQEITELEQGITELEIEITELETKMEKIHIRRRALRTVMNENHDLIHQFPPEIASHIFMQYSSPSECTDSPYETSPLYLGAVCQKWRQLAWATPDLWTSLHIKSYNRDRAQLVFEWLDRSGSLPLAIRLSDYGDDDEEHHDEVINILNKHSARWHDMQLALLPDHLRCLSGSSQENILRRLVLCLPYPRDPSYFSTFSMKSKPSPTDLTLLRVGLPYVGIVWNNLIVASIGEIGVDECFELIRRAPLLETLRLHAINPSSSVFPIPSTRIVRPHLHSLELSEISKETVVTGILDSLHLPSLKQWTHDHSPIPLDNMMTFIRIGYLSSSLNIFKIGIDQLDYRQVPGLLFHLPSLQFLELRSATRPPSTTELISLLCASAQSPLYLPHLQSLEISYLFDFPWKSLPQIFALPRWKSLRVRIKPVFGFATDDESIQILVELGNKGFDCRVASKDCKDWVHECCVLMMRRRAQNTCSL